VVRVLAQRFEPGLQWQIETDSIQMVKALSAAPPAVYIRVDDDLSWRLVSS
jgi:crossover junction endodeoxyribonuclease RusA